MSIIFILLYVNRTWFLTARAENLRISEKREHKKLLRTKRGKDRERGNNRSEI
jgi:hypothetical protein